MEKIPGALTERAQQYTKCCLGSYRNWSHDIDLGPHDRKIQPPKEDADILDYYNALQYTLYETNCPETADRTNAPRGSDNDTNVAIAVLSSPVECMAILLEGGRQCPGNVHLILSTSWLTRKPEKDGRCELFINKAITFETERTYLDVFEPPRRVTYLMNYFTACVTDGKRCDGEALEQNLICPMSSSVPLCRIADDKLMTRVLMAEMGVPVPVSMAFTSTGNLQNFVYKSNIAVHPREMLLGNDEALQEELRDFIQSATMRDVGKIVVKPSGIFCHSSYGVTFHSRDDLDGIMKAAKELALLNDVDSVLIESFHETLKPTGKQGSHSGQDLAFRLKSIVCRGPANTPVMTQALCGVASTSRSVNGDNTVPQTLETTLQSWSFNDFECRSILDDLKIKSELALTAIMVHELSLTEEERGGRRAQTDLIGLDFILTVIDGVITPVCIKMNSHDCTINCQILEYLNPQLRGTSVGPLISTMTARSQSFIMEGKHVLVVGAGGASKMFVWGAAKDYGLKTTLVDSNSDHPAASIVDNFIHYDFTDHHVDDQHAHNIVGLLKHLNITVDGCTTLWEDCAPLAATVAECLGLRSPGHGGTKVAKMKSLTHHRLMTKTTDIPHWPRTYLYAVPTYHIETRTDIDKAAQTISFPAVLKLEYGSSAVGTKLVKTIQECYQYYEQIQEDLKAEQDHPGIGLGHGNSMLLMEYIEGTEHDVDIVLFDRKLVTAFVLDNGPTHLPYFTETAACLPSFLTAEKQNQLIAASYQCATDTGLTDGVFNVEMKMTLTGPKLIEINARMGGFYKRDWIRTVYGADILLYNFMICCGLKPVAAPLIPYGQLVGVMCVPSQHKEALNDSANLDYLHEMHASGHIRFNQLEGAEDLTKEDRYEEPVCNIAAWHTDREEAKNVLLKICKQIGLETLEYPVSHYISDFAD